MPTVGTATIKLKMDGVSKVIGGFKKIAGSAKNLGAAIFKAVAVVGVAAFAALTVAAKKVISLAIEQERAEVKLAAVLRSTGNAAGFTAKQMFEQAKALSAVTEFSDQAVIGVQAILSTFTEIRGDEFIKATEAVADMSALFGGDLKGSAIQLGKALNNPIAGMSALAEVGVSFSNAEKEMITNLQNANNVIGAQNVILDALANQGLKDAARAAGETFGGQISKLKNLLGELGEEAGFVLMAELKTLIGGFETTGAGAENLKKRVRQVTAFIVDAIKIMVLWLTKMGLHILNFWDQWKGAILAIVKIIKGAVMFVIKAAEMATLGLAKLSKRMATAFGNKMDLPVMEQREARIAGINKEIAKLVANLGRIPKKRETVDSVVGANTTAGRVDFTEVDDDKKKKAAKVKKKVKEKIKQIVEIQPEFIGVADLFRKVQVGLTKGQAKKDAEALQKKQLAEQKKANQIGKQIVEAVEKIGGGAAGINAVAGGPGRFG